LHFVIFLWLIVKYSAMRCRLTLYKCTGVSELDVPYFKVGNYIVAKRTARKYRAKKSAADDQWNSATSYYSVAWIITASTWKNRCYVMYHQPGGT